MKKSGLQVCLSALFLAVILCFGTGVSGASVQPVMAPVAEALTPAPSDSSASDIDGQSPSPATHSTPTILPSTKDAGQDYIDGVTFLGDSTSYGFIFYESLTDGKNTKQVWTGFDGTMTLSYQSTVLIKDPSDGAGKTIRECVEQHKPKFMIITLGLNGISFMDKEYFTAEYKSLVTDIQALSPETTIVLQSIFPISPLYVHWGSITNDMVVAANSWILEIAEETGCPYLDTFSVLAGDDGNLKRELESGDGIHLNSDGLNTVLSYIRTHAYYPDMKT